MKEIHITTIIKELELQELSEQEQMLVDKAHNAAYNAYAPYSQFKVGCAVLLENNEVITGSNQENAAYPSGLCAERVALFYAGAQYPNVPVSKIVVIALKDDVVTKQIVPPCAACRQVMLETESRNNKSFSILLYGSESAYFVENASDLVPLKFNEDFL